MCHVARNRPAHTHIHTYINTSIKAPNTHLERPQAVLLRARRLRVPDLDEAIPGTAHHVAGGLFWIVSGFWVGLVYG